MTYKMTLKKDMCDAKNGYVYPLAFSKVAGTKFTVAIKNSGPGEVEIGDDVTNSVFAVVAVGGVHFHVVTPDVKEGQDVAGNKTAGVGRVYLKLPNPPKEAAIELDVLIS